MYSSLDALLMLVLIDHYHDRKEGKKVLVKMRKKFQPGVQATVIQDALDMGVKAAVDAHYDRYLGLQQASDQLADLGAMGMVMIAVEDENKSITEEALPVFIHVHSKEDKEWLLANEADAVKACANAAMRMLNLRKLDCRVVLFSNFGFSGQRHRLPVAMGPDALAVLAKYKTAA